MANTEQARTRELEHARTEPDAVSPWAAPVVESFGLTDQGRRRPSNEDGFLIATLERALLIQSSTLLPNEQPRLSTGAGGSLYAVADGMGGLGGGDVASRIAIETVAEYMLSNMPWVGQSVASNAPWRASLPGVRTGLDRAVHAGDEQIKRAQQGPHPHMGTTLTLAYVPWPRLYVAHAGDSRCYMFRNGALGRLTHDHSVAEQIKSSGLSPLQPDAALQNVLWNALGAESEIQPEIERFMLAPGDVLLLCTDGLYKHVPDPSIARILGACPTAEACCHELVNTANAAGGTDNITLIAARFLPAKPLPH